MKACFMGLGYIGLPTSIIAAKNGIQILGVDINPKVVEKTNAGELDRKSTRLNSSHSSVSRFELQLYLKFVMLILW